LKFFEYMNSFDAMGEMVVYIPHKIFTFARKTFGGLGGAQVYRMTNTFEYGNSTTFDISTYSWCRSLELKEEHVSIAKSQ